MKTAIRVLIVDASENEAQGVLRSLEEAGFDPHWKWVETAAQMASALEGQVWDVILCEYSLPHFDAFAALKVLQGTKIDIPFIIVSGKIGEVAVVAALKAGAHDHVRKDRLDRLAGVVAAEIGDAKERNEHRRQERVLGYDQEMAWAILEKAQDAYIRADNDGRIMMVSPSAATVYGYGSTAEMLGLPTLALYADEEERRHVVEEIKRNGSTRDRIGKGRKKDGTVFWVSLNTRLLTDSVNQVIGTESFVRDITDRKQVEEALRMSELKYRSLIEASSDAIFCVNENGEYTFTNKLFAATFGKTPDYFIGKTFWDIYPKEHADYRFITTKRVFQTGNSESIDVEVPLPDRTLYFYATANPIKDDSGKVVLVLTHAADITERKRIEAALQKSELEHRTLLQNINTGIVVHDSSTAILLSNASATFLLGLTEDQMLGKTAMDPYWRFLREDGSVMPEAEYPVNRVLSSGASIPPHVLGVQRPDREAPVWLLCNAYPVLDAKTQVVQVVATFTDITERKRAEQEQREMQAQRVQSQRLESIGTLASGVAHEINNPLNVVMNFAQLILDEQEISSTTRDFATNIVAESERMATIVQNLLAFSRNDRQEHSPADVATLVRATLGLIQASFRKEQIELVCEIQSGLPKVRCRSQQIQQVLLNLLTNARDALNQRFPGPSPDKVIRVVASRFEKDAKAWVRLTVEDKGGGLAPDVAPHVFDPFFTTKPRDQGTGLGLSISHGIVKEHKGELWFESQPGEGAQFHVDLKGDNGWSLS